MDPIISTDELRKIKDAINKGKTEITTSFDLGITKTKVKIDKNGFYLGKEVIALPALRDSDDVCFAIVNNELKKVQFTGEDTRFLYKLVPTSNRPILQVSGTGMHKRPFVDRVEKDKLQGKILDTGMGLGYTAIQAAKTAKEVVCVEIDNNVIEMARYNPYSQDLFTNDKISIIRADITEEIENFKDNEFDNIIFDAGTPRSSGTFFSTPNYEQAFRILKKGGRLYHYLPQHHMQRGRDFPGEVIARMEDIGFVLIERNTEGSYAIFGKKLI
ncbi:MAG TPA: methyltransferase domain-containing protein [Candidatus Nanoarchaeia archaeon]|nr:methyltransferase domain-containing protein [Candidatus Nanoarchaeia archaeon]